jgi:hypothetical protein
MSKYATEQMFGGQRASVGRVVVIHTLHGICADTIDRIAGEAPVMKFNQGRLNEFTFHPTTTAADVEAMPPGCWTWPPRV